MALGKTVSAASCGVNAVGMLESVERRGLRGSCEDACPREPAEDRIRDLLSFLDRTASNSLHCDGTTHTKPHPPAEATSNANLLSKISALEVELEDKEHSLKALRQLREREKLKAEHTRNQLQFQLREEMTKTTVSRSKCCDGGVVARFCSCTVLCAKSCSDSAVKQLTRYRGFYVLPLLQISQQIGVDTCCRCCSIHVEG